MIRDLEDLKCHESAHYAMAVLVELPVVEVAAVGGSFAGSGRVLYQFSLHSSKDAVRQLMVIFSGLLEQLDWEELTWGRLDPQRSSDERQIVELIKRWRIPRKAYDDIFAATLELRCTREFDRLQGLLVAILDDRPVVSERLLEAVVK